VTAAPRAALAGLLSSGAQADQFLIEVRRKPSSTRGGRFCGKSESLGGQEVVGIRNEIGFLGEHAHGRDPSDVRRVPRVGHEDYLSLVLSSEVGPSSTRRLRSAGFPFGFGGHAEPLTCFSYSFFSNEGSGACRTNLAAHRRSNLLSRSRGIELITTPGFR
jgi:hypothetical protein